ncbi:hypothetical protein MATL_G00143260 [Megalops atlanticus]|uniref:Sphingomyelin phosphodiesterase 3 n=1 Tax=Megalops atlanticus TaxID=7932 RepID=A0A9D3T9P6_MEGAT|nr:hypothetical protein MATL_G00143260 [Megalops atlanticus]
MVLHTSAFSNDFLHLLNSLSWVFIFPCYWLLDRLLASFVATTKEKRQHSQDPCSSRALCALVSAPLYLTLILASLPFALLGFLLWAPLQAVRRPYVYSQRRVALQHAEQGSNPGEPPARWRPQGRSFCFCSANVCLLPDSLARFNNLSDTQGRAREVGTRIRNGASRPQIKIFVDSPTNTSVSAASFSSLAQQGAGLCKTQSVERRLDSNGRVEQQEGGRISISASEPVPEVTPPAYPPTRDAGSPDSYIGSCESLPRCHPGARSMSNSAPSHCAKKPAGHKCHYGEDGFDHEISAFFPANLDFLCLQEVFDRRAAFKLRQQLHHYFPFMLSDVGRYAWKGCCSQFKFLNSGLLLASRYPILDAEYQCYPNGRAEDALAAKGALFVKVQLGTSSQDQKIVGYITCTHLHAIEGDAPIRCKQLDLLLEWGAQFRKTTSRPAGTKGQKDQIAFDVILGDLNFDNCSSDDKLEQQHTLFSHYKDPCRLGPGEDQLWATGTLLDTSGLYDEEVTSPEGLQKVMENEEGRKEYLVYPTSKKQCSNQKGRKIPLKGNGRRIDYILYSEEQLQQDWKVDVEEYSFITQLAGLTDHLAVAMRLAVSTGEEE